MMTRGFLLIDASKNTIIIPWNDKDDFISFEELVVKALPPVTSQEPFMNKPCVAHQVCHEDKVKILDKIRTEIADLDDAEYEFEGYYKAVNDALQIIDKYKAESEDKE